KSYHGYLNITATWLSSEFKFKEALIFCDHLAYPHSKDVIFKEIRLLHEIINDMKCQPCAAHTLQLLAQHLCEAQYKFSIYDEDQNIIESPLDIITDTKIR
ncbi:8290_t:CDS:2, partial [Cetraspora pellucida]